MRVSHQGSHALIGRITEKRKDQVAAEKIGRIVRCTSAEEIGENQPHDQKRQQRRQNAPGHAQYGALVFCFKVAFDQLLKEKLMCFKFLYHRLSCLLF